MLAVGLLLAPAQALWRTLPTWTPAGDNALIELRARDVGTSRTPLVGQPSTARLYSHDQQIVHHPGPIEFYLMAGPVRLLGGPAGMLLTSTVIVAASVLVAAWAAFRQLGPSGGLLAAAVIGLLMFTTGSGSLVDPVSSNIAGYPLLATVVLSWCLLCGDHRLLPLTAVVASFAAQQHLAALVPSVVLALGGCIGLVVQVVLRRRRGDNPKDLSLALSVGAAAALTLLLWSPVLYQQVVGPSGNLAAIASFGGGGNGHGIGLGAATRAEINTIGLPPILGQTNLTGLSLLEPVSPTRTGSAALIAAVLIAGAVLLRRRQPRFALLVVTAAILAVAGLFTATHVPDSFELGRLVLFHWATALSVLIALGLGVLAVDGVRWMAPKVTKRPARFVAAAAVIALLVGLVAVNPSLDRPSNSMAAADATVPRSVFDSLAHQVIARRSDAKGSVILLRRGAIDLIGQPDALASRLAERGLQVVFPEDLRGYVDPDRLAEGGDAGSALVVVIDPGGPTHVPGKLIADADAVPGFDHRAYQALVRQAEAASSVRLGSALEANLRRHFGKQAAVRSLNLADRLAARPGKLLLEQQWMEVLAETPPQRPALDKGDLRRLRDSFPSRMLRTVTVTRIRVYELNHRQLRAFETADEKQNSP